MASADGVVFKRVIDYSWFMETPLTNQALAVMAGGLAVLEGDGCTDVELIERIGALETVKNAAAAAQARAAVALRELREEQERAAGRPTTRTAESVAAEVALARRESPHRGRILMGLAVVLGRELPRTSAVFAAGRVSEYRAMLVARETACLSREDRGRVDAVLADELPRLSDRQLVARARQVAYALDPHSVVTRASRAEADRRVTIRPAADMMTLVSALLPMAQGVAVYAALSREADRVRAAGDPRSRGQVMADALVCRATGQAAPQDVAVEVQLVVSDEVLLGGDNGPGRLAGYGPVPAGVARRLVECASRSGRASLRRVFARPMDGRLVAMESTQRTFPAGLRRFIETRDEVCRTPWCGAPIRHADHVIPARSGGATHAANGQGLCQQCNLVKEHPGWHARPGPGGAVAITTPSGAEYTTFPPPVIPVRPRTRPVVDLCFRDPRISVSLAA